MKFKLFCIMGKGVGYMGDVMKFTDGLIKPTSSAYLMVLHCDSLRTGAKTRMPELC